MRPTPVTPVDSPVDSPADGTAVPVPDGCLADVDEGAVVDLLTAAFTSAGADGVLLGIGDDAAVVDQPSGAVVATTDTMVRDLDWRDDWSSGHDVGTKTVTQNVADVAAMGAVPTGLLVTLAADPATPLAWVADLARGIAQAAAGYRVPVVGGDLSSAPAGVVTVSVTALGDMHGRRPVTRSGARPGDVVAVGGSLGRSGAGLALYLPGDVAPGAGAPPDEDGPAGAQPDEDAREACRAFHRAPTMPAASGPWAADAGATSMIDVSDGLSRDAARVARASGVVVELDRGALVDAFCGRPVGAALGMPDALDQVLHGGEEHSLLATFPAGTDLAGDPACTWTVIGRVRGCDDGERPGVLLDGEPLVTHAWDHFAG